MKRLLIIIVVLSTILSGASILYAGMGQVIGTTTSTSFFAISAPSGHYIDSMDFYRSSGTLYGKAYYSDGTGPFTFMATTDDIGHYYDMPIPAGKHLIRMGPDGSDILAAWAEDSQYLGELLINYMGNVWNFTDYTAPPGEVITGFSTSTPGTWKYLDAVSTQAPAPVKVFPVNATIWDRTPTFEAQNVPMAAYYGWWVWEGATTIIDPWTNGGLTAGRFFTPASGVLKNGHSYTWDCRSYVNNGWGVASGSTPGFTILIEAPTKTAPAPSGVSIGTTQPTFQVDAVSEAANYGWWVWDGATVVIDPGTNGGWTTGNSFTPAAGILQAGHSYTWDCRAHADDNWGAASGSTWGFSIVNADVSIDTIYVSNSSPTVGSVIIVTAGVTNNSSIAVTVPVRFFYGNPDINYTVNNPHYGATGLPVIKSTANGSDVTVNIPAGSGTLVPKAFTVPDTNFYRFSAVSDPERILAQTNWNNDTMVLNGKGSWYPPGGSAYNVGKVPGGSGMRAQGGSIAKIKLLAIIFGNNTNNTPAAFTSAQIDTISNCLDAFTGFMKNHTKTMEFWIGSTPSTIITVIDNADIAPDLNPSYPDAGNTPYLPYDSPRIANHIRQQQLNWNTNFDVVMYIWRGSPATQQGGLTWSGFWDDRWSDIALPVVLLGPGGDDDLDQLAERMVHEFLHHVDAAFAVKAGEPNFPHDHEILTQTTYPNDIPGRWKYYTWICETWPAQLTTVKEGKATYKGWNAMPAVPATPLGVEAEDNGGRGKALPAKTALLQNSPNPVQGNTAINYQLATPANVSLKVYNISGQLVKTLASESKPAGYYSVRWDGRDANGNKVAAGVYLYRLDAGSYSAVKKMTVIR